MTMRTIFAVLTVDCKTEQGHVRTSENEFALIVNVPICVMLTTFNS